MRGTMLIWAVQEHFNLDKLTLSHALRETESLTATGRHFLQPIEPWSTIKLWIAIGFV